MEAVVEVLGCVPLLEVRGDCSGDMCTVSVNLGSEGIPQRVKCEWGWCSIEHAFCEACDATRVAEVGVGVSGCAEDVQEFGSSPVVKKFAKAFDLEGKSSAEGREGSCQPVLRTLARNREELLKLGV